MAKLKIIYEADDEIEQLIKEVEDHVNMSKENTEVYTLVQRILQKAFNEGRKFQKQIGIQSPLKDSLIFKTDID